MLGRRHSAHGGKPVGVGGGGAGTAEPGGHLADWTRFRHQAK